MSQSREQIQGGSGSVSANQNMVAHTELPAHVPHEKILTTDRSLEYNSGDSGANGTAKIHMQVSHQRPLSTHLVRNVMGVG